MMHSNILTSQQQNKSRDKCHGDLPSLLHGEHLSSCVNHSAENVAQPLKHPDLNMWAWTTNKQQCLPPPLHPSSESTLEQRLAPTSLRLLLLSLLTPSSFLPPNRLPSPSLINLSTATPSAASPSTPKLLYLALRGRAARIKYLETRRGSSATARQPLRGEGRVRGGDSPPEARMGFWRKDPPHLLSPPPTPVGHARQQGGVTGG